MWSAQDIDWWSVTPKCRNDSFLSITVPFTWIEISWICFSLEKSFKRYSGLFLFYCNYGIKNHYVPSLFYSKLFQWWSEFRDGYETKKEWQQIVWNNTKTYEWTITCLLWNSFWKQHHLCKGSKSMWVQSFTSKQYIDGWKLVCALHHDVSHTATGVIVSVRNFCSGLENAANFLSSF